MIRIGLEKNISWEFRFQNSPAGPKVHGGFIASKDLNDNDLVLFTFTTDQHLNNMTKKIHLAKLRAQRFLPNESEVWLILIWPTFSMLSSDLCGIRAKMGSEWFGWLYLVLLESKVLVNFLGSLFLRYLWQYIYECLTVQAHLMSREPNNRTCSHLTQMI